MVKINNSSNKNKIKQINNDNNTSYNKWKTLFIFQSIIFFTIFAIQQINSIKSKTLQLRQGERNNNNTNTIIATSDSSSINCAGNDGRLQQQQQLLVPLSKDLQSCNCSTTNNESEIKETIAHSSPTEEECRNVFGPKGQGGGGLVQPNKIKEYCSLDLSFNVCTDLQGFTGLTNNELQERLQRIGRYHYEAEHSYWYPQSITELTWFYTTSINYLFANSVHPAESTRLDIIASYKQQPILDYSGGVGNNIIYLTSKYNLQTQYFGIGMAEYNFAKYRINKRNLQNYVKFIKPYSKETNWIFDPIHSPLPRDGSLGAIMAMDVLEHIPSYHIVVNAMIDSIRVGGIIFESSPFDNKSNNNNNNMAVHVSDGGITMEEAMGTRMVKQNITGINGLKHYEHLWVKVSN